MIISDKISSKITNFIASYTNTSKEDLEKINYGLLVIILNFFKLVLLLATAYILGVLNYTVLSLLVFGALRIFASGPHSDSSLKCIILNYIFFLGDVYLSIYLKTNIYILTTIFLVSIILILLYAPADTAKRPIVSAKLRKKLKIYSLSTAIAFFIICLFNNNMIVKNIIIFAILEESICLTPFFYKISGKSYKNYENLSM